MVYDISQLSVTIGRHVFPPGPETSFHVCFAREPEPYAPKPPVHLPDGAVEVWTNTPAGPTWLRLTFAPGRTPDVLDVNTPVPATVRYDRDPAEVGLYVTNRNRILPVGIDGPEVPAESEFEILAVCGDLVKVRHGETVLVTTRSWFWWPARPLPTTGLTPTPL